MTRYISPEMQAWVRKVDSLPIIVRDLDDPEKWIPAPQSWLELEELIGDYSEGFFLCSYNDDDVLALLVSGNMDQEVADIISRRGCIQPAEIREDGQYAKALMDLVEKAGGWIEYINNLTRLEPYLKSLGFTFD